MQQSYYSQISHSYHFKAADNGTLIRVFNSDHYLMAEYLTGTGRVSWQRVVAGSQRESVERWLHENYPVQNQRSVVTRSKQVNRTARK